MGAKCGLDGNRETPPTACRVQAWDSCIQPRTCRDFDEPFCFSRGAGVPASWLFGGEQHGRRNGLGLRFGAPRRTRRRLICDRVMPGTIARRLPWGIPAPRLAAKPCFAFGASSDRPAAFARLQRCDREFNIAFSPGRIGNSAEPRRQRLVCIHERKPVWSRWRPRLHWSAPPLEFAWHDPVITKDR